MSVSLVLLVLLGGALLVPLFGGGDDDGDDNKNELLGTPESDTIEGTDGNDLIRTWLSDDTVYGNGGNDEIRPGGGNDYVEGGDGLDFIRAEEGDDAVFGNDQDDRIFGDKGDDWLDGGRGSDVVRGGWGNDLIFGGSDNLDGQTDVLSGEDNSDTIFGWGDGTSMNGGLTDVDNPNQDNDDTLVMVTGEGEMENRTGDNTNIGLANVGDEQDTFITVTDFDIADDTLVLTIDYETADGFDVDPSQTLVVSYSFEDSEAGGGMKVTVSWVSPDDDVVDQESASAFLVGVTQELSALSGLEDSGTLPQDGSIIMVEVYLTNEASLDDPLATMGEIGYNTLAMQAWPSAPTPPVS